MSVIAVVVGLVLVVSVLADVVNTLVTTSTSTARWWLTRILYVRSWALISWIGRRCPDGARERLYSLYAPLSVLAMLVAWVTQQIVGFGLIWWGVRGGIEGIDGLLDSIYFSGVVYFTVGFGEVVPVEQVPRFGALVEAFSGVLTTALVIGYLPSLYSAYSEREQKLLTLDDGSEGRITPTNLVLSRVPDGDVTRLDGFFQEWEAWIAQVLETHSTFPMLRFFRSQQPGQNWITALGLVADAALHMELTEKGRGGPAFWTLRRATELLQAMADGVDVSEYRTRLDEAYEGATATRQLYDAMTAHGLDLLSMDEAITRAQTLRRAYDAQLEFLIDAFDAPRGFWAPTIGHRLDLSDALLVQPTSSVFDAGAVGSDDTSR